MRMITLASIAVGTATGLLAAVASFHGVSTLSLGSGASSYDAGQALPAPAPRIRTVEAPCEPPALLRGGICVTVLTRTIVVADPPKPSETPARTSPRTPTDQTVTPSKAPEKTRSPKHRPKPRQDSGPRRPDDNVRKVVDRLLGR